jgi:hypothetical protein
MNARKRTSLEAVFAAAELPPKLPPKTRSAKRNSEESSDAAPVQTQSQERAGEPKRPHVKQHTAYLPLPVHEQLRKLAFEENGKMHDYLIEGLNRVFADRGLPTIEELG